ncbi:MAG: hypothetical protein ACRDHV_07580 [Actinomycetota bacterium]
MQQTSERSPVVGQPSRRRPPRNRASAAQTVSLAELERLLEAHERAVRAQLDDGLRSLYRATVKLMRQVAAEAWRAGGPGADERLRDRIVGALARDDALRALLTQADERNQALRLRVERIERAVRHLITANRAALQGTRPNGQGRDAGGEAAAALVARVESLAAEVTRAGARQHQELAAFTRRTAEGLAQASRRVAEELARRIEARPDAATRDDVLAVARAAEGVARRQEEHLERRLDQLRASFDALTRASERPREQAPQGRSGSAPRLRALERRLARISGELAALSPGES